MHTTRRTFIGAGAGSGLLRASAQSRARPNIILVYTDQQRYDTIAALGNRVIRTPNMDRLVREGVTFTHATTPSPVCMAARWSMQTGQWTTTHRCYSNHDPGPRPSAHLPGMLASAGYRTGLAGKNHTFLGAGDFDVYEERPKSQHPEREAWLKKALRENPRLVERAVPGGIEQDDMHAVTNSALRFLEANRRSPFFLIASYLYPHTPYHAPEPYFSMYANSAIGPPAVEPQGLRRAGKPFRHHFHHRNNDAILPFDARQTALMRQVYYGMITLVDAEIGRLLLWLDDQKLTENTLLVFTSDHGDYMGDHGLCTKSPSLYDCLTRVPMIVRWPGRVDPRRLDSRFASHIDVMPTFAAAAGVSCPAQAQGVNLLPFLGDGGHGGPIRPAGYSEYGVPGRPYDDARLTAEGLAGKRYTNPNNDLLPWEGNPVSLAGRIRMVRTETWKYVEEPGGTDELYDLKSDPHELRNLAKDPDSARVLKQMKSTLAQMKGRT
jgi:arylsulfatase A-like enzyme